jgi:O-antigen/teichoic acid export membrane protein
MLESDISAKSRGGLIFLRRLIGSLARWRKAVAVGASEQVVSSVLGFLAQIVVIRSLSPTEYGSFAVAWTVQSLAQVAVNAVLTEPIGTVAIQENGRAEPPYLARLLILNVALSGLGALVIACVASVFLLGHDRLGPALLAGAATMPAMCWFLVLRAGSYANGRPSLALGAWGGAAAALSIGALAMRLSTDLTASAGIVLLGAMSLCGAIFLAYFMGVTPRVLLQEARLASLSATLRRHWRSGRWLVLNGMALQASRGLYIPLAAALIGLEAAGMCRAVATLLLPLQKMSELAIMLLHPIASARVSSWSRQSARAFILKISLLSSTGAIFYAVAISLAGPWLMRILYVHDQYVQGAWLLPVFAFYAALVATTEPAFNVVFRGLDRFDFVFAANAAGAAAFLTIAPLLACYYGLAGIGVGLAASGVAASVCSGLLLISVTRRPLWRGSTP